MAFGRVDGKVIHTVTRIAETENWFLPWEFPKNILEGKINSSNSSQWAAWDNITRIESLASEFLWAKTSAINSLYVERKHLALLNTIAMNRAKQTLLIFNILCRFLSALQEYIFTHSCKSTFILANMKKSTFFTYFIKKDVMFILQLFQDFWGRSRKI